MKKLLLALTICAGLLPALLLAQEEKPVEAGSPEDAMYNVSTLIGDGRIGYAATLYMPPNGIWSNCDRNALIATENVLFAIRNGDLRTVFEQAPYLPGSKVTTEEVSYLIDRIPTLTPEQKADLLLKCNEKCVEAQRVFQIVGSMQILKRFDIDDNTVAFLLKETDAEKTEYFFTALLSRQNDRWLVNYIMLNGKQ